MKKNLKFTMLLDLEQFYKTLLLKKEQDKLITTTLKLLKIQELLILYNLFLMLNYLPLQATLETSFSWLVMPSQYFHQFLSLLLLKLYIISILDILLKLQEHNKELNSQYLHFQHALEKHFYHLNLKFMLIYLLKRFNNMELMFGLSILDGLEENMELERESVLKQQEILLMLSMMARLLKLNSKPYLLWIFNIQSLFQE